MSIANNIKKLREIHNLSQAELAEIAGVTDKAVSTWENGINEPRMGTIQKMADYFGIYKSNIIEEDGLQLQKKSSLNTNIKKRREELGISQDDLAKKIGYTSRSTIAKIESGENDITQSKIEAFANALETTPSWLMGWEETGEKKEPAQSADLPEETIKLAEQLFASFGDTPPSEYTQDDIDDIVAFLQVKKQKKRRKDDE